MVADDVHVPKIAKGVLVLLVLQVGKELSVLAESHCPEFGDLGDDCAALFVDGSQLLLSEPI